ncbi:trichohyalin [Narcine bancroftii]|uniref:trichohyalin n=1 Tax=Narcine bancroftii TaxID=1343680 RepID=UPI003831E865
MSPKTLKNLYRCAFESILAGCITAWCGGANGQDNKKHQRVVKSACNIMSTRLLSIKDIYMRSGSIVIEICRITNNFESKMNSQIRKWEQGHQRQNPLRRREHPQGMLEQSLIELVVEEFDGRRAAAIIKDPHHPVLAAATRKEVQVPQDSHHQVQEQLRSEEQLGNGGDGVEKLSREWARSRRVVVIEWRLVRIAACGREQRSVMQRRARRCSPAGGQTRRQWRSRAVRVLAERNQAVVPVGAWVESAREQPGEQNAAFISALEVDEQLEKINRAKAENLKRFQDEVKHRVTEYSRICKKHQQQRTYEAVKRDDRVIKQSSASAEQLIPNKSTCLLRGNNVGFAIFSPSSRLVSIQGIDDEKEEDGDAFNDQARQLSKVREEARHRLASCQTVPQMNSCLSLPGGIWKVSATKDNSASRRERELSVTEDFTCLKDQHDLPAELQEQPLKSTDRKHVTFQPEPQHEKTCSSLYREPYPTDSCLGFSPDYKAMLILRPGVDQEESKKQRGSQYLMNRRLYMDIEREQVKEQRRQQQHLKRIAKIKEEKEKLRETEERRMIELTHQRESVSESERSIQLKEEEKQKRADQNKSQRHRASTRYIEALRAEMLEKIKLQNTDLPPLCCCGSDFWDSHPDKCANNCVFYKNPKVYARALQSVLSSNDTWDGHYRHRASMKKFALMNSCPIKK